MSRIYTRTGDTGDTGLFGGQRVPKDDLRVEAYGTVDELNAVLGLARAQFSPVGSASAAADSLADIDTLIQRIQNDLFSLGADLATPEEKDTHKGRVHIARVTPEQVAYLEARIDHYESELPPLTRFILPGGSLPAAALHHARVVCRRAERRCVTLAHVTADTTPLNPNILRCLNRLSDLLFVLARVANQRSSVPDVAWTTEADRIKEEG